MFSKINEKSIQEQSIDDLMQNLGLDDESNSPSLKSPSKKKKGKKRWEEKKWEEQKKVNKRF